jgi:hypothetical protein
MIQKEIEGKQLKQVLHFPFSFEPRFSEVDKALFLAPHKCVVNNVIFVCFFFLYIYIHIIRDPVNGAISSVGLTCHL